MSSLPEVTESDYSEDEYFYSDEELVFDPREHVSDVYSYIKEVCRGTIYPLFNLLTEECLLSFMYPEEGLN
jgi:hypothetical protein